MTNVLLKELSNSDIQWMVATGQRQEIAPGTVIIHAGKAIDHLHILLDGTLTVMLPQTGTDPLVRAFSAIEGNDAMVRDIARLSSGDVVGETSLLASRSPLTTVKAVEPSLVIALPQTSLRQKLTQDVGFASRFYRAIALLISRRLKAITQDRRTKIAQRQPLRDVLFILSALNDSDIDWIIATGQRQKLTANTVLIREDGPVDALYLLIDGMLSMSIGENQGSPLVRAFAALEGSESSGQEIARLVKGEIIGETPFIDADLPTATVRSVTNATVLAIARRSLAAKLQQDMGFSARFYQVIATLLSYRLQNIISCLGFGRRTYHKGQPLDETSIYDDELDLPVLDQMEIASTRFEWMFNRLKDH
jgi:bacteriocin-type transport-associated protein